MQRWALTLLAYEYELLYCPRNENGNADGLSRLPILDVPGSTPVPGDIVHFLETINTSPVDATKIKLWTACDPVLSQVLQLVLQGWPSGVEEEALNPYFIRREELSVHAGCLLWEARVIVPPQGREELLNILHDTHPVRVKMRSLARSYVWWPKMDTNLEEKVKSCATCQSYQKDLTLFAITPLGMPGPRSVASARRLCGSFYGKYVLADH